MMFDLNRLCVLVTCIVAINSARICKVPNGGGGTCIPISKCRPLYELDNQPDLSEDASSYIQQSMCGSASSPILKVCCPPESDWSHFKPNPIIVPTSAPSTNSPNPKPAVLARPDDPDAEIIGPRGLHNTKPSEPLTRLYTGSCGKEASSGNRIFGGEAATVDQFPWLVLLEYAGGHLNCGGSLISSKFVLTAAHCIETRHGAPAYARLGEYNTTSYPTDFVETDGGGFEVVNVTIIPVERSFPHEGYGNRINDIALVKLKEHARFDEFIRPICLPSIDMRPQFTAKTNFTIAGWGYTDTPHNSDIKNYVMLPYADEETCQTSFPLYSLTNVICAGGVEGRDSCDGDSGGPLMYEENNVFTAVGVLSYGRRICGTKGSPAVYTNVYSYLKWIREIMER